MAVNVAQLEKEIWFLVIVMVQHQHGLCGMVTQYFGITTTGKQNGSRNFKFLHKKNARKRYQSPHFDIKQEI